VDTIQANVTGKKTPLTITIKSAMELSGLSRPTINRLIWSKKLRTTHVGSRHLIFFDSFQKMLGLTADTE
jgi:excisionase family DNA binding protein